MAEFVRRLIVAALGVGLMIGAGVVGLILSGIVQTGARFVPGLLVEMSIYEQPFLTRLAWAGAALVAVVLGAVLVRVALVRPSRPNHFLISRDSLFGGGELTMGRRGLLAMAARSAAVPGVREVAPVVHRTRKGWKVSADLILNPDATLPDVAERAADALRRTLELTTGIPVTQIDVNGEYALLNPREPLR